VCAGGKVEQERAELIELIKQEGTAEVEHQDLLVLGLLLKAVGDGGLMVVGLFVRIRLQGSQDQ
jgi:hypothetical protein